MWYEVILVIIWLFLEDDIDKWDMGGLGNLFFLLGNKGWGGEFSLSFLGLWLYLLVFWLKI